MKACWLRAAMFLAGITWAASAVGGEVRLTSERQAGDADRTVPPGPTGPRSGASRGSCMPAACGHLAGGAARTPLAAIGDSRQARVGGCVPADCPPPPCELGTAIPSRGRRSLSRQRQVDRTVRPSHVGRADRRKQEGRRRIGTALCGGNRPCNVVFCHQGLEDRDLPRNLLRLIKAGGVVVVCGSVYPAGDSPLGDVWPAKATPHNSWTQRHRPALGHRGAGRRAAGVSRRARRIPLAEPAGGDRGAGHRRSGRCSAARSATGCCCTFLPGRSRGGTMRSPH